MNDPLRDPRFPDRPQHPDFWRMSEVVLGQDADSGAKTLEEVVGDLVDFPSLEYMAAQRAAQLRRHSHLSEQAAIAAMAAWLTGFAAGAEFQRRGGHRAE